MPLATFNVAPMPAPAARYQSPSTITPASVHSFCSCLCVPLSSPRLTNGAVALAISIKAPAALSAVRIPAGSSAGPTKTKSLYMISRRCVPNSASKNWSSAARECTRMASTSPASPRRSAWPVPTTINWISNPRSDLISGNRTSDRPEL